MLSAAKHPVEPCSVGFMGSFATLRMSGRDRMSGRGGMRGRERVIALAPFPSKGSEMLQKGTFFVDFVKKFFSSAKSS